MSYCYLRLRLPRSLMFVQHFGGRVPDLRAQAASDSALGNPFVSLNALWFLAFRSGVYYWRGNGWRSCVVRHLGGGQRTISSSFVVVGEKIGGSVGGGFVRILRGLG